MPVEPSGAMSISELAERAGVTPRTVRYYVAEGLLPPPGGAGQQRVYSREHLLRLLAIKRLKEAYLPLGEIRRELAGRSLAELERLAARPPAEPRSSALDYLASVLPAALARCVAEAPPPALAARAAPAGPADLPAGALWRRVLLAPGVELHYQLSGDRRRDAAIARIIQEASRLLADLDSSNEPGS